MKSKDQPGAGIPKDCILWGGRVALDAQRSAPAAIVVRRGKIEAVLPNYTPPVNIARNVRTIELKDHLILPGLVNVHDHLHLGNFPRLGQGPYPSWREWAKDIYQPQAHPLQELLQIPKDERLWAGILRNAIAGVTTVCHHDASDPLFTHPDLPLTVHSRFGWAHSSDGREWRKKYAQTPPDWPFIIHCAEGLDPRSRREIMKLKRDGVLNERMILVHAVGITKNFWPVLFAAGVWIVWCPTSNLHILGRTLSRDILLNYPFLALGSDSPISANGDLLDELHTAYSLHEIPAELLYTMVTDRAAKLLRLTSGEGNISSSGIADLLIIRDKGLSPCESLVKLQRGDLMAVMHHGEFSVASGEFHIQHQTMIRNPSLVERHKLVWHLSTTLNGRLETQNG